MPITTVNEHCYAPTGKGNIDATTRVLWHGVVDPISRSTRVQNSAQLQLGIGIFPLLTLKTTTHLVRRGWWPIRHHVLASVASQ